jgi:hypothetical protein
VTETRQHYNVTFVLLEAAGGAYSLLPSLVAPALPGRSGMYGKERLLVVVLVLRYVQLHRTTRLLRLSRGDCPRGETRA